MPDVMIDLETLGTRPGCVILSIGAVVFNRHSGELGPEFYMVVNRKSCQKNGLFEEQSTLDWWARQSAEARKVIAEAEAAANGLGGALIQLTAYLQKMGKRDLLVWGCGSDFDIGILTHCYAVMKQPLPWLFWNSRCLRTLRDVAPPSHEPLRKNGVAHSAIDDARNQALEACQIFKALRA
jgi:hypothetical protein